MAKRKSATLDTQDRLGGLPTGIRLPGVYPLPQHARMCEKRYRFLCVAAHTLGRTVCCHRQPYMVQ